MDIFLIDPAGTQLQLPVNPEEISIQRERLFETVNIINLGEVDFPTGEKIKEITFSSFFPKEYDSSYCRYADIPDPQQAMNQLTAWTQSNKPVRLIITGTLINALVLVSVHNTTFKGGEPDDVYYELTLRTWREIKVRTVAEITNNIGKSNITTKTTRTDTKPVPAVYTVKAGDSLFKIAKLQYGDSSKWKTLYEKNKTLIGDNPNLIKTGQKLVMA